jgi:ribokinase
VTSSIVVLGSLNMDFVVRVTHLPAPGETVLGREFRMIPGGKGANQACAAGKLVGPAVQARMIGRVGYDVFADQLKASLAAAGVDVAFVHATKSQPTGVALIWVDDSGQNSIVVASGANHAIYASEIEGYRAAFRGARFALFQLETPVETVRRGIEVARQEGARTMLDPAPARPLPPELLAQVDILTPNESEACMLLGRPPSNISPADAPGIARDVRSLGPTAVVLKLGDQGCFYSDAGRELHVAGFPVIALDTTAAGDTFNAAFAVALAEGLDVEPALRFANAAAAISVTRLGAQVSQPSRAEVDRFLADRS